MTDSKETISVVATPNTKRARERHCAPKASVTQSTAETNASSTPTRRKSKSDLVLSLLRRPEGTTIEQLVVATGWLPHTARAALTGLKKKGHLIASDKPEGGERIYRVIGSDLKMADA